MYKRPWGYFLLTMLVVTGLAGRQHSETFSGKERRILIRELKNSSVQILQSVEPLNNHQLRFKDHQGSSIERYMRDMVVTEAILWQKAQVAMKQNTQNGSISQFNEQSLIDETYISNICSTLLKENNNQPLHLPVSASIIKFKSQEDELLRYLRTSTNDVHHQFAETSVGRLTIYELMMLDITCIQYYQQQIEKIKNNGLFPN